MAETQGLERVFQMIDNIQDSLVNNITEFVNNDGGGPETTIPAPGQANPAGIDATSAGVWTQTASGRDINIASAAGTFIAGNESLKSNYLNEVGTQVITTQKNTNQSIKQATRIA